MAKRLTTQAVECLRNTEGHRLEVPDALLRGLYLVIQPSGAKSWAVRYRYRGRPRKLTLGRYPAISLAGARELARRAFLTVGEGRDPCGEKRDAKRHAADRSRARFVEVAIEFIERHAKANNRESTWRETERLMKRDVIPLWRDKPIEEIARRDVVRLLDRVQDRGSPIMANRVLAAVRRMFAWCVDRGLVESSPCAGLRPPSVERSRDRVLSDDELRSVWLACEEVGWPFGPLVKLLILTGQRLNEVSRLQWAEIDVDAKLWTIPRQRTKNDVAHTVPLSTQALAILSELPVIASEADLVFTTTGDSPVGGFSRAKERIDHTMARSRFSADTMPRWTFHDLRRTVASGMARLKINIHVVEKLLNHSSGSFAGIVAVYQRHTFAEEKREALQVWGDFVEQLVSTRLPKIETADLPSENFAGQIRQ